MEGGLDERPRLLYITSTSPGAQTPAIASKPEKRKRLRYAGFASVCKPLQPLLSPLQGGGRWFKSSIAHLEVHCARPFFNPDQHNMPRRGRGGGQMGVRSAPSVSSCNRSSFACIFSACFGLPIRLNSCICRGHDSRALSGVPCSPKWMTSCLTLPFSR
jgi:hypothetical protein